MYLLFRARGFYPKPRGIPNKRRSFCLYSRVTNWATYNMKPRITILPSLRLGGHNNPDPFLPYEGASTPSQGPSPLQGKGCNRSHPLARSLRYPRPIRESRGDSLRNRVAIVCVRSAHLYAKNHPILVLVAIVCAGFAHVCSNLVIWKTE